VNRILVDTGSSVDILIAKTFNKMSLKDIILIKASPVYDFASQPITIKGSITFLMVLGYEKHIITQMVDFLVVAQTVI
ncbi:hypothetical protein J1N35_023356, partial [Gossypium stocksii]